MAERINAADVLNLEHLRAVARSHDLAYSTDPRRALEIFAFAVVQGGDAEEQNTILKELLARMTYGHSKETNRIVLKYLAEKLNTDLYLLTKFARQEGIQV